MSNSDPFLNHEIQNSSDPERKYPFLMRVGEAFDEAEMPGLEVSSKLGSIWACRATASVIAQLEADRRVIAIEGSRPMNWGRAE